MSKRKHKNMGHPDIKGSVASFAVHRKEGSLVNAAVLRAYFGCTEKESRQILACGLLDGTFSHADHKGAFMLNSSEQRDKIRAANSIVAKSVCEDIRKKVNG